MPNWQVDFYPSKFDADKWVQSIKASGARYICFTTRHHEGFSMFDTKYSDYNVVKATPFKKRHCEGACCCLCQTWNQTSFLLFASRLGA